MKKILFVIDSLTCGGAEKSLINLLSNFDYENYHVDLMVFRSGGKFEEMIPREVNFINAPHYFMQLQHKEKNLLKVYIIE